jgi:hypothetical protein
VEQIMIAIQPTLKSNDTGPAVANLQSALAALVARSGIKAMDPPNHPTAAELNALVERMRTAEQPSATFGAATAALVRWFQVQQGRDGLGGTVDAWTANLLNERLTQLGVLDSAAEFSVSGTVRTAAGRPIAGAAVCAFDRDLRKEQPLGQPATTNSKGEYSIAYTSDQFKSAEHGGLDVIVRAFDAAGALLAASETRFNAGPQETVDLTNSAASPAVSEFERCANAIVPLLAGQGPGGENLAIDSLTADDIKFIVADTGLARETVQCWIASERVARQHDMTALWPAFYAWFRAGLPQTLERLTETPTESLLATLKAAISNQVLPKAIAQQLPSIHTMLDAQRAQSQLQPAQSGATPSLGDLLMTLSSDETRVVGDPDKRRTVASLWQHSASAAQSWDRLQQAELGEIVPALQRTTQLSQITLGHVDAIKALQARHDSRAPGSIEYLAAIRPAEWLSLAFEQGPPPSSHLSPGAYADSLRRNVERTLPMQSLRARLAAGDLSIGSLPGKKIADFLAQHADFDLARVHVEPYLSGKNIKDVELRNGLLALQRIQTLTPYTQEMGALLSGGWDSAARIAAAGPNCFNSRMVAAGLSRERAAELHARARRVAAASVIVGTCGLASVRNSAAAVPAQPADSAVLDQYPSLRTIFGDQDYCECRECQSVLGPAAYYADLLHMLESAPRLAGTSVPNSPQGILELDSTGSVLQALLARRPDLVDLELSCENTNLEIPYIDLVLETLENAVALPLNLTIPSGTNVVQALGASPLPSWVRDSLAATAINVGKTLNASSSLYQPSAALGVSDWVVKDGSKRWTLRYIPHQMLASIPPQVGPRVLTLANLQADVDAFKQQQASPETRALLAPEPKFPLSNVQVVPSASDKGWGVAFTRGAHIALVMGPMGTVTVTSLDGQTTLYQQQYQLGILQRIAASLGAGLASGAAQWALAFLGIPVVAGAALNTNTHGGWDYTFSGTAVFILPDERLSVTSLAYQNSGTSLDLTVAPQNRNPAAYQVLADTSNPNAVYPWALPFDHAAAETRAFMDGLGVSRARLLQIARPQARWADPTYVYEVIGTTAAELALIAVDAPAVATATPQQWGLQAQGNSVPDRIAGETRTGTWLQVLRRVSMVMQQADLTYREYLELLETRFVGNPQPQLSPPFECRPSKLTLTGLDDTQFTAHLDRVHRFTRLRRRLRWSAQELDLAIAVYGGEISSQVVQHLGWTGRLAALLGISVRTAIATLKFSDTTDWIDKLAEGTPTVQSLYAVTFLRVSLRSRTESDLFVLKDDGTELAHVTESITAHADYVAAALAVEPADILLCCSASGFAVPDQLCLANLEKLFAITTVAAALDLSVENLLRLVGIVENNPFATDDPAVRCRQLIELAEASAFIATSGVGLEELEYLLRHRWKPDGAFTDEGRRNMQVLSDARGALRAISIVTEPSLDNLRNQLIRLGWPAALIDDTLGIGGLQQRVTAQIVFDPALATAPSIPSDLAGKFQYVVDPAADKASLSCTSAATAADFGRVSAIPRIDDLRQAHEVAFDAAVRSLESRMQSYVLPEFSANAGALSLLPTVPDRFAQQVRFEVSKGVAKLVLRGWLREEDRAPLKSALKLNVTSDPVDAVMLQAARYSESDATNYFVTLTVAQAIFTTDSLADRIKSLLDVLLPYMLRRAQHAQIVSALSAASGVDAQSVSQLVDRLSVDGTSLVALLTDSAFVSSSAVTEAIGAAFPNQLRGIIKAMKAARLFEQLAVRASDLPWLLDGKFSRLDFNSLPDGVTSAASYVAWHQLVDLITLRRQIPGGAATVAQLAQALNAQDQSPSKDALAAAYSLDSAEVAQALGSALLSFAFPSDFADPTRVMQAIRLLALIKRLGAKAAVVQTIVSSALDDTAADSARKLFCAQFEDAALGQHLKPISDRLRTAQRDALVAYLRSKYRFDSADSLFEFYLIDTQMGACMLTSRLKQAISSVQLFFQRCLLGLEHGAAENIAQLDVDPDAIDRDHRNRWSWMKNYRVWEANREIFLYPENWLEPELLDIKSDLLAQLETDLSQDSLSDATLGNAVKAYVDALERTACVDVIALHVQGPPVPKNTLVLPQLPGKSVNSPSDGWTRTRVLHVVARTMAKPSNYLYRRLTVGAGSRMWSPWERIDTGGELVHVTLSSLDGAPVLFWLSFLDDPHPKAGAASSTDPSSTVAAQLSWIARLPNGKWSKTQYFSKAFSLPRLQPGASLDESYALIPEHHRTQVILNVYGPVSRIQPGQSRPDIQNGIVGFDQLVNGTAVGIAIYITVQNADGDYVDADIRIWMDDAGLASDGSLEYVVACSGKSLIDPPSEDVLRTSTFLTTSGDYNQNIEGTGSRLLLTPLLQGRFSIRITLRDQSYDFVSPDTTAFTTGTDATIDPDRTDYLQIYTGDTALTSGEVKNSALVRAGRQFHLKVLVQPAPGVQLPSKPKPWALKQFGSATLYASGRQMTATYAAPGRDFPVPLSLPGTNQVNRTWSGNAVMSPQGPVYYDLAGPVLTSRTAEMRLVCDFGANWLVSQQSTTVIGENWTAVQDAHNAFLSESYPTGSTHTLAFHCFDIPPTIAFIKDAPSTAPDQLLDLSSEAYSDAGATISSYQPHGLSNIPIAGVSFDYAEAYAAYYWELYFHLPLLIATRLHADQQFEHAQRWFHLVFDPTAGRSGDPDKRYWAFKFFQDHGTGTPIATLLQQLAQGDLAVAAQIGASIHDPFNPHAIARLRPRAYAFQVVIRYIQNLIAWGDSLFRRDTIEALNEATQYYVLAAKLLGRRPASSPGTDATPRSYRDLSPLDPSSNAWISVEPLLAPWLPKWLESIASTADGNSLVEQQTARLSLQLGSAGWLYFCVPRNSVLDGLWDTVADRLFKIRNCMNFDGIERQLPLFEPPIDPALLVRAAAAGVDIATVLADLQSPMSNQRFAILLPKAIELSGEVRSLGASLLSAIEKQDGETLALLRSSQEIGMLNLVKTVKEQQRDEAQANVAALRKTREISVQRYLQYQRLLSKQNVKVPAEGEVVALEPAMVSPVRAGAGDTDVGQLGLTHSELDHLGWLNVANNYTLIAGTHSILSSIFHSLPDSIVGWSAGETNEIKFGGSHMGAAVSAMGALFSTLASNASFQGGRSATVAGYQRRFDEWAFQSNFAAKELEQIDRQIAVALIRVAVAEQELKNHEQQIRNAQDIDRLMREKFSDQQLYQWMTRQTSTLYFRAYQLAYDLAKRAERAYRYELGLADSNFVQYGYWDTLRKGLMAGEQLQLDLRRLEQDYLERNKRELEITKQISLRQLDPIALIALRATGECQIDVPEWLFDLDFPGHYFRRLKSVAITVPCVVGPYTDVSGTLALASHSIRRQPIVTGTGYDDLVNLQTSYSPIQSIATSSGVNDSGLFELNFRDERYLPFEGAGAISRWNFRLPQKFKPFDYHGISDVILHLRYTARDAGTQLASQALDSLTAWLRAVKAGSSGASPLGQIVSLRHELPSVWAKVVSASPAATGTEFKVEASRFPYLFRSSNYKIAVTAVEVFAVLKDSSATSPSSLDLRVMDFPNDATAMNSGAKTITLSQAMTTSVLHAMLELSSKPQLDDAKSWYISVPKPDSLKDLFLLIRYQLKDPSNPE